MNNTKKFGAPLYGVAKSVKIQDMLNKSNGDFSDGDLH